MNTNDLLKEAYGTERESLLNLSPELQFEDAVEFLHEFLHSS